MGDKRDRAAAFGHWHISDYGHRSCKYTKRVENRKERAVTRKLERGAALLAQEEALWSCGLCGTMLAGGGNLCQSCADYVDDYDEYEAQCEHEEYQRDIMREIEIEKAEEAYYEAERFFYLEEEWH